MTYKFGNTSRKRLSTCHPDIQRVLERALELSPIDFTVVCGERNEEDQMKAFNSGNSKAKFGQSPHNKSPSMAVDICPYVDGALQWDNEAGWFTLYKTVMKAARELDVELTWGGHFKSITDKPHWELTNWKQ